MSFSIKKNAEVVVVDVEGQLIVGNRQELKQKTAYAIGHCDWSSDVCSSDLKLLLTFLPLVENLLLQLLPVPHDELAFDIHHDDLCILLDRETHSDNLQCGSDCSRRAN